MAEGDTKAAPADRTAALSEQAEWARLSALQVAEYDIDDLSLDDDGDQTQKQEEHFKRGEKETILKVLNEMEEIALKRTSEGFNEINFSLGVLNCFLISYLVGECPQHLWLFYLIEAPFFFVLKFYKMWFAKPLNQALYYMDFCWIMNFLAVFFLGLFVSAEALGVQINEDVRAILFKSSLGVACGVLMMANIVLNFVACIFHDVSSMTSLFIHLMPPMVMYTLRWHSDDILSSWPNVFTFSYLGEVQYFGGMNGVAGCSAALYFMWWIFYSSFMLLVGINLPRKLKPNGADANPRWDTVFHSTMRQGVCVTIGKFRKRPTADSLQRMEENNFDMVDFFLYMMGHMVSSMLAICTVGYGCFSNKYFFKAMLGASAVLAVVRGGKRYTYYSTKMYSKALKKRFSYAIESNDGKAGYSRMS